MIKNFKTYNEKYITKHNYLNSKELDEWNKDIIKILNEKFYNNHYPDKMMWSVSFPYYYIELNDYYGRLYFKKIEISGKDTVLFIHEFTDDGNLQDFLDKIERIKKQIKADSFNL